MGIVREPKGVDFIIQSPPLTIEEQKEISEFIKLRKQQNIAEQKIKSKSHSKLKRPKTNKMKPIGQ